MRDGCARAVSHDARVSHAAALCAVRALYARPLACLGLSPFVCARRSVSVRCPLFLCVGRCERLCHSPRACTPSTLSLRETSPHQPPHTRRPPRVTCDRGSRTLSSPRRGRDSAYRPEPRGHFLLRWTSPRHTLARAWVRPHRVQANPVLEPPGEGSAWHQPRVPHLPSTQVRFPPMGDSTVEANLFLSHQGRGVPGTNHVCHNSPRLRFAMQRVDCSSPERLISLTRGFCATRFGSVHQRSTLI